MVNHVIVLCANWTHLTFTDRLAIARRIYGPILPSRRFFVLIETANFVDEA